MAVEGILLTGGASRRMGADKASLTVGGQVLAARIAESLQQHCSKVTVLGREPIEGYGFLADAEAFSGPLSALAQFTPSEDALFIASCDLPRFDGRLVALFNSLLADSDAVMPQNERRVQPLCGIYRERTWNDLRRVVDAGKQSLMAWIDLLQCRVISSEEIALAGIDARAFQGANSPEELHRLLSDDGGQSPG